MRSIFLIAVLLSSVSAHAGSLAEDVMGTLYGMKSVYSAQYAPAAWKKKYANYDLNEQFSKDLALVQNDKNFTMDAARSVFKDFISSMRDYHTSIQFVSTEAASLPFAVKSAGDRFFIVYIDRTKLTASSFPFSEGDEVVTFDGMATKDAVAALQNEFVQNVPETDKALAEISLTRRSMARGVHVPHGPVTVGIQRQGSKSVVNQELIWDYTPEQIAPRAPSISFDQDDGLDKPRAASIFHPMMSVLHQKVETPYDLGARKTFTPDLGTKLWESGDDNEFYAYTYMTPERKIIGFVRIPEYMANDYDKAVSDFAKIIQRFQTTTDAMVIDQVNNPGGSVFYLYTLASMLTDQPLHTPLHRMAITQKDVLNALTSKLRWQKVTNDAQAKATIALEGGADGYPVDYEFARFYLAYNQFIIDQWTEGRTLSEPYWIGGVNRINPAPVHYTKPILILTNHLDFSGGDFFPATLQDNNRVKILGSRTAGAGGYVLEQQVSNNVGIAAFRVTGSIAERLNGNPIENLGVKPDYEYEFSAEDYTGGYAPYVKAIQSAVAELIK